MKCLYCKKKFIQSKETKFKPFCSERCRSLDLSNWLSEKNIISSNINSEVQVRKRLAKLQAYVNMNKQKHHFQEYSYVKQSFLSNLRVIRGCFLWERE